MCKTLKIVEIRKIEDCKFVTIDKKKKQKKFSFVICDKKGRIFIGDRMLH